VVKDSQGTIIGECISGNILITDDHKRQQKKAEDAGTGTGEPMSKERSLEEESVNRFNGERKISINLTSAIVAGRKRKEMPNSPRQLSTPPTARGINATSSSNAKCLQDLGPTDVTAPNFQSKSPDTLFSPVSIPTSLNSITMTQPRSPIITKIVPSEGPTTGGIEVVILGKKFTSGITAQFGEATAISTEFHSPTTLVCLLPPSITSGPVFVTLKSAFHSEPVHNSSQIFTYVNAKDSTLMELLNIMLIKR
jgi:hypothetical protein